MAYVIGKKRLNLIVSHLDEVRDAVHDVAKAKGRRADLLLGNARATTQWFKIVGPGHLTEITVERGEVDSFFSLVAPDPMAIEFGHAPSGVFGPGGIYEHIKTKAPDGLYILTRAAG